MRSLPPFALAAPEFRFRGLALLAGRAALGSARELVLGVLLGARLVDGVVGEAPLETPVRRLRAAAAKTWLSSLALPAAARSALSRLVDATGTDDRHALSDAWEALCALAAPALDVASRAELRKLSVALSAATT